MKALILSTLLLTGIATVTKAQSSGGVEIGGIFSNYTGKANGATQTTQAVFGYKMGGIVNLNLAHSNFFLQTGMSFFLNGFSESELGETQKVTIYTDEIPLNLVYKFGQRANGFFIGVGPYFAFNFGGSQTISGNGLSETQNVTIGSTAGTDDIKMFDFGFGGTIGYGITRGFFVSAHYQLGFTNLEPGGNGQNTMYSTSYGLSIGYLFGSRERKRWGY